MTVRYPVFLRAATLPLALNLLLATGCLQSRPPVVQTAAGDIWAPWRQPARLAVASYQADEAPVRTVAPKGAGAAGVARFAEKTERPFTTDLSKVDWAGQAGIEISFRFRVERIPPGRLESSRSLAKLVLGGGAAAQEFYLHAYSGNSGFLLNGLANRRPPWQETPLLRGAATPASVPKWDTQWHTVTLAWCRGQLAASWDGLPILHVLDPAIDFRSMTMAWVDPGPAFGALELQPIEVRTARFAKK